MFLTMKRHIIATTVSTTAFNDLVQDAESITVPPYTNAFIKYKVPKILKSKNYERVCVFEPSYRHKSNYSHCTVKPKAVEKELYCIPIRNTL